MSTGLVTASYIGATILFILTLGGLSHQETARKGNIYGILGMALAILATILGPEVSSNYGLIIVMMCIGATIGLLLARKIEMTQMPELVAILHSLVGLAAVLVGYVNFIGASDFATYTEKVIHEIEIYIGVLIGAVTFSGSIIAFAKLSAKISGAPLLLPARHWLNLILLLLAIWLGFCICGTGCSRRRHDPASHHDIACLAVRGPYGNGSWRCRYARHRLHAKQLFRLGGIGNRVYAVQ